MLPWKLRKRQFLPVNQNLSSVHFSLAKFQLVSSNLSLAMIWQMTDNHKLPKLCSATLKCYSWPHPQVKHKVLSSNPSQVKRNRRLLVKHLCSHLFHAAFNLACEYSRFSLLLATKDVWRRRKSATQRQKFKYWWRKICPESGQELWLVDVVVILF